MSKIFADIQHIICRTALFKTAQKGDTVALEALYKAGAESQCIGANVNLIDTDTQTPLFWTALRGYIDTTELLLKLGADVNYATKDGKFILPHLIHHKYITLIRESPSASHTKKKVTETAPLGHYFGNWLHITM